MSHPSWVCGLKLVTDNIICSSVRSHPSWVCGLKLLWVNQSIMSATVTPFVGVWIETCSNIKRAKGVHCHTLRGCVDWNPLRYSIEICTYVTPFVGVWIETSSILHLSYLFLSHPSWVCGLKLLKTSKSSSLYSHTLRGCVDWNCFGI